jgi:hypothetical protein
VNEEDDDQIRQAFCFGGGFREKVRGTEMGGIVVSRGYSREMIGYGGEI